MTDGTSISASPNLLQEKEVCLDLPNCNIPKKDPFTVRIRVESGLVSFN